MSPNPERHLGTVLVVDDAPDTLRMLCDALAAEGYTVLVAMASRRWSGWSWSCPTRSCWTR